MVLVVAGNITPEEVLDAADRLLKPAPALIPAPLVCDEPTSVKETLVEDSMPVAAPLFYLGFKEPSVHTTPLSMAGARILVELIAGKSSPLYTRLMDLGLINDQFEIEYFAGPGYGAWLVGGESADPLRIRELVQEELRRLQKEGLDPAAIEAVRRGAYGRLVAGLDDPSDCAELILAHLVDGVEPLSELDALATITPEELNAQLRSRIDPDACTLSIVHPL